jgi:hypothetical protein
MARVKLEKSVSDQLLSNGKETLVCDDTGAVIGHFRRSKYTPEQWAEIDALFPPEEMEKIRANPERRIPMSEVFKSLGIEAE